MRYDWDKWVPVAKLAVAVAIGAGAGIGGTKYVSSPQPASTKQEVTCKCDCKYPPIKPIDIYLNNKKVS